MISTLEYFPAQMYTDKNGPCSVEPITQSFNTGNNQQILAAVAGKRIVVISGTLISNATASSFLSFKSASGGTVIHYIQMPANTATPPGVIYPENKAGWFKTKTGEGLFVDVSGQPAWISLNYFTYTP